MHLDHSFILPEEYRLHTFVKDNKTSTANVNTHLALNIYYANRERGRKCAFRISSVPFKIFENAQEALHSSILSDGGEYEVFLVPIFEKDNYWLER